MLLNLADDERRRNLISLTPLIDVVFILLLFFMLSSTFSKWHQMTLQTATSSTTQTPALRSVIIESNQGDIRIDSSKISIHDSNGLQKLMANVSEQNFVITASKGITIQTMVTVLDGLKSAGAKHVSFAGVIP